MSGLAQMVLAKGGIVSGSDIAINAETEKLQRLGATIYHQHNPENLAEDIDLVVYTSAISKDNPELIYAEEHGVLTMERSEFLGVIARGFDKVIAVAGTHGKTTTTAMIAEIFSYSGLNPTIHLGGESIGLKGNTIVGDDDYLIVEACEYKESFRFLRPYIAIITNIEADHLDYYKDYDDVRNAFLRFANNSSNLISLEKDQIDHDYSRTIFGDWTIKSLEFIGDGYNFNVYFKDKFFETFRLNMLGEHNVTNALFAIATTYLCGIKKEDIVYALSSFQGVERRYERIYTYSSGCRVIIDYAHHPTELKSSIEGLQGVYERVLYVFQPHTYTRTKALFDEFIDVINSLSNITLFATYPAREKTIAGGTAMDLYSACSLENKKYFDEIEDLFSFFQETSEVYDCILVLGAGSLAENLKRKYNNT